MKIPEIAVGARMECSDCGETLERTHATGNPEKDFIEVASREEHACWTHNLEGAEHMRIKDQDQENE